MSDKLPVLETIIDSIKEDVGIIRKKIDKLFEFMPVAEIRLQNVENKLRTIDKLGFFVITTLIAIILAIVLKFN